MKHITLLLLFPILLFPGNVFSQPENSDEIIMLRDYSNVDSDLRDIINLLGVEYLKMDFVGEGLKGKSYHLITYEIWNGEITDTTTVINSMDFPINLQRINEDSFQIRVSSKLTDENKLKMLFRFPGVGIPKEFDAVQSEYYSLRFATQQAETKIQPGENFFALTYILPYEVNGTKQYCTVDQSGDNILGWGEEFDLEHYLVFEMQFKE